MSTQQKILELNAFDMSSTAGLDPETARLVERRRRTFGPTSMLFYKRPLNVVRAEGVWLYEADGTRVLDAYNNVPSIGHCHPAVVAAVARQISLLNIHTRYLYDGVYTYAERLLATMPAEISNIVFTCTGSESADFALRAARGLTGGTGFIVTANAYHGNTLAVTEVSPSSASAEPRPPNIAVIPAPDTYRWGVAGLGACVCRPCPGCHRRAEVARDQACRVDGGQHLFSDGVYPGASGFLKQAVDAVRAAGGLYIADEVQPGFGRTGGHMWGFERHDVVPDIVIMGKPMGNGFPMGGVAIKPDLLADFGARAGYFNTFGGNPVAAAAGLAVWEALQSEGLQENAEETGTYLREGISALSRETGEIGDVRSAGLYLGVECVAGDGTKSPNPTLADQIVNAMRERGVLIGTAGIHGNILKIRPPLAFRREHADIFLVAFAASVRSLV